MKKKREIARFYELNKFQARKRRFTLKKTTFYD